MNWFTIVLILSKRRAASVPRFRLAVCYSVISLRRWSEHPSHCNHNDKAAIGGSLSGFAHVLEDGRGMSRHLQLPSGIELPSERLSCWPSVSLQPFGPGAEVAPTG